MIEEGSPKTKSDLPNAATDLRVAIEAHTLGLLRSLPICFPVCVYSYDRYTHTVGVMPLVKQAFYNGKWEYIRRQEIFSVSIRNIQCGGFTVDVPMYIGDTGWVFSSDADTLLLKQDYSLTNSVLDNDRPKAILEDEYQQNPSTPAKHSLIHGFFLPDNWGTWEIARYKDNPQASPMNSLYIGSSIDTSDERENSGEKTYQKGDGYESRGSASLLISREGEISLSGGTPLVEGETGNDAHISVMGNGIEIKTSNPRDEAEYTISLSPQTGMVIEHEDQKEGTHLHCAYDSSGLFFRLINELPSESDELPKVSYTTLKLDKENFFLATTVNLNSKIGGDCSLKVNGYSNINCKEKVNIRNENGLNVQVKNKAYLSFENLGIVSLGQVSLTAENINLAGASGLGFNSGGNINLGSGSDTNINGGTRVNLAAGSTINITAPNHIRIVSAYDINIVAKATNASIKIETLSKVSGIEITTGGTGSPIEFSTKGKENSPLGLSSTGKTSPIQIKTDGEYSGIKLETNAKSSNIDINASDGYISLYSINEKIDITAGKDVSIYSKSGNVKLKSSKIITMDSENINIIASNECKVSAQTIRLISSELYFLGAKIRLGYINGTQVVCWD